VLAVTAITFALILSRSHAAAKRTETVRELVK
jgi:hypothetical protein